MNVCMHTCMYACMYECMSAYVHVCVCVCIFFMHFCPGTITTHAESINSDLQRGQTFTTHTTLNTEQNQLAIEVSADN